MIEIRNVSLRLDGKSILNNISLTLELGKIYGLVGSNGSGKTMLMKCICGFVHPTEGEIKTDGRRVGKDVDYLPNAGIIIETPGFIPYMSGKSNLKNLALIRNQIGNYEIEEALRSVGLDPNLKKHVSKYSLGMRQRLGIAQAIMEKPRLLILDEPFNGLDVQGVKDIRELLMSLQKQGVTILLASHYDEDIRTLCEEVYLVREHRIRKKEESDGAEK